MRLISISLLNLSKGSISLTNDRIKYSEAQQTALVSQVNRVCPLCAQSLFYTKKSKTYKNYELAHIFPLNPTEKERELLKDEELLSNDVNDERNIIPLCKDCHGKFDTPRTVEEYRCLFLIKKKLIAQTNQELIWKEYNLEGQISDIIKELYSNPDLNLSSEIDFTPKAVDDKLDDSISRLTKRKIKNNVSDYYLFIKNCFSDLDQKETDLSEAIACQVKAYYIKQKGMGLSQQEIFENIVSWMNAKTNPQTSDATEILVSFYIQNCEVF